jgi:hypothetical protein
VEDRVVERGAGDALAAQVRRDRQAGSLLDPELAGQRRGQGDPGLGRQEPGEEPELAQVDPQDRRAGVADHPAGAQHRAIAAQGAHQVDRGQGVLGHHRGPGEVQAVLGQEDRGVTTGDQPAGQVAAQVAGLGGGGLEDESDQGHGRRVTTGRPGALGAIGPPESVAGLDSGPSSL